MGSFAAYWMSESVRYGDAPYYAHDIILGNIIEPGHLLWRPLGALIYILLKPLFDISDVLWILQGMNLIASVASVGAMFYLLSRWCSTSFALWGTALFAFSNGFWFYAISGSSYSLSVLFMILAFNFAFPTKAFPKYPLRRVLLSAVFGGLSALSWLVQGLNLPSLLLANVLFRTKKSQTIHRQLATVLSIFLIGYLLTLGLPAVGTYLWLFHLKAWLLPDVPFGSTRFLTWLMSSGHGIPTRIGIAQVMRLIYGWSQTMLSAGDIGTEMRLWLLDETGNVKFPLALSILSLVLFYFLMFSLLWIVWRRRSILSKDQIKLFTVAFCSFIPNFIFGFCWQGTDLERYLPSVLFLILFICIASDNVRYYSIFSRTLAQLMILGAFVAINWLGTFYPVLSVNSYRQQWLSEIRLHMNSKDLLIIIGSNKSEIVSPHNPNMPRIANISILIGMRTDWRSIVARWIQQTKEHGGRVMIGNSVLGLDNQPRDGWSFKEYPIPSPKDLDEFFAPMKGDIVFSAAGEHVWLARVQ